MRSLAKFQLRIPQFLSASLLILLSFLGACNQETDNPPAQKVEDAVKQTIFESMQDFYFWEDKLPKTIKVSDYASNQELLNAISFKPLDRFSYLTTREEFNAAFTGQVTGVHGFGIALDKDQIPFVGFVFKDGPAGKDGWQRGWEIIEVNGKAASTYKTANGGYNFQLGPNDVGVTNRFKFKLADGSITERTIRKESFQSNSELHKEVIETANKKIGYWVYNSFRATSGLTPTRSQEVEDAMVYFQNQGINELIIDLRYNGGGSVAVAEQILNYIVPSSANDKTMYVYRHNTKQASRNRSARFRKIGNLNFNRVVFITSRGSASASELVINSLDPYLDVVLIGDNTFGKPVGSFPLSDLYRTLRDNNVEIVPITFAIDNADGRADYFEGFPANFLASDNPARNWGDREERRLKAALEYIINGSVSARIQSDYFKPTWHMIDDFKGLQQEFPLY
jgi:carboxyl-terminal processing protease